VSEQRHKGLSPAVNPETVQSKRHSRPIVEERGGREFTQLRLFNDQRQAGVATGHRMADAVALHCVKEKYLVCFCYGLVLPDMANVNTAIRKHKLSRKSAFFWALMSMCPSAVRIPYRNGRGLQERVNVKLR